MNAASQLQRKLAEVEGELSCALSLEEVYRIEATQVAGNLVQKAQADLTEAQQELKRRVRRCYLGPSLCRCLTVARWSCFVIRVSLDCRLMR